MSIFDIFRKEKDDLSLELENYNSNSTQPSTDNSTPTASEEVDEKLVFEKVVEEICAETTVNCITMELTDEKPSIFQSKIGGIGYVPHDGKIPTDSSNNQLKLLAQIDCNEVKLEDFPKSGLLQFWILNDDLYGLNFDNATHQNTFRVIYYENIDKTVTEDEIKSKIISDKNENYMPINGEFGIKFTEKKDFMTIHDFRFEEKFCNKYNKLNSYKPIKSLYDIDFDDLEDDENKCEETAFSHKIGGYPAFTQEDPRVDEEYDFLLFQLDSDYGDNNDKILWGDVGIGNFFINSKKLKNLDFSDVMYNWDCC